jgi:hypothetical protein
MAPVPELSAVVERSLRDRTLAFAMLSSLAARELLSCDDVKGIVIAG